VRIHWLTVEQALSSLNASLSGLETGEAVRRLGEFGPNLLEEVEQQHLLLRFAQEFTHFFAIVLWIGAGLSFVAEHFDPGQGMAKLGLAIVGVIIINGVFSFWQEYRAERAVAALRQLLPQKVKALRAGEITGLLASELVPGDIVLLEEGDFVPADCRLTEVSGLRVNLSTVTGESLAKARTLEPSNEESPLQAANIVLAGTSIVSGQARAVVYATGMRTEFGRIAHLTQTAGESSSPLQREIARLSRIVACLATGIGLLLFLVGQAIGLPTWENLLFAIGIIVANVPEGLLPTVTLSLAMATQRMARRNALVRHLPAVEALGSTTVICSDKTGTLTQNRMSVQQLWIGGAFMPMRRSGAARRMCVHDHRALFVNAALCHNLKEVDEEGRQSLRGDPMEIALAEIGREISPAILPASSASTRSLRHRPQAHVGDLRDAAGPHALLQGRSRDGARRLPLHRVRRRRRATRSQPPAPACWRRRTRWRVGAARSRLCPSGRR
jgi:sodium/potassium-transporting ATPase subunit alpha